MSLDETLKTNILNTTKKIKNYIDSLINSHTHGNISNDGKVGSTSGKPLITTTNGAITTGSFGSSSGTFCQGNDSRLSDPRTPTIHTHSKSEITDFPSTMTPTSHSHGNLQNDGSVGTSNNASKNVVTDANGKITTEAKQDISGKADKLGGVAQVTDANSSDYTNIFTSRGGVPYYSSGDDNQQTINMFIDRQLGYKAESNHNHSGTYAPLSHTQASSTITDMSTVQVVVTYTDETTETLTLFKQTSS